MDSRGRRALKPVAPFVDMKCRVLDGAVRRCVIDELGCCGKIDGVLWPIAMDGLCDTKVAVMQFGGQTIPVGEPAGNSKDNNTRREPNGHNSSFTIRGRLQSFRYALRGIALMLKSQHNAWLHAIASCCILVMGGLFKLTDGEWCWVILAIMAVWTAEALNTALEFLADVASPEFHPLVKQAKDVAAGGVLISAMGSVIIGLLVLGPHLLHFLARLL